MRPAVVVSILEADAAAAARALERVPERCDLVEIRADELGPEEIGSLVRRSPRPAIVTVRSVGQGGRFAGGAEEQWERLRAGLGAGAAFVDVELSGPLARLAWGPHARRVILSHHGVRCRSEELIPLYRAMAATPAARLKIVPRAESPSEIAAVRELLEVARAEGRPLACFALGLAGQPTRILAPSWGSWATYGSAGAGLETGEGQLAVTDLLDLYDVLSIGPATRRFALVGSGVSESPSPAMHAAAYREAGIQAVYVPIEARTLEEAGALLEPGGPLGVEAFAVTIPLKEDAARRCRLADDVARLSGAVNTVVVEEDGWTGYNTDGPAARALLAEVIELRGAEVAIAGAGGTARGIGAALALAGARVTLFARALEKAERAASAIGAAAAPLDALPTSRWDALVNATPVGRAGERLLPAEALSGRAVLDAPYGRSDTPLVQDARASGLATFDGVDLLAAQATLQFERMTGARSRQETLRAAARARLSGRSA